MAIGSTEVGCGVFLPLVGLSWPELLKRARLVEELGFQSFWIDDHFWFPGAPDREHLEVWTALSALATTTERCRLGPLVMCHSYRSPGMLAKMASSLSCVSGGRLILGLGAGYMAEEYDAFGYPMPSPGKRVDQLGETLEILRLTATKERASFQGQHHVIREAPLLPKPERLPILLGGAGDRFLELVARYADIWNCPNPAWRELEARREKLSSHCDRVGRDPSEIEISEQVVVVLGRDEAEVAREVDRARGILGEFARFDGDVHVGTPDQVAESLRARCRLGVESFCVMFGDFGSSSQIEIFGREVLPQLA